MLRLTRREFVDLSIRASAGAGLVGLAGCGGSSSSSTVTPPPPPPTGGTLITPEARATAVKAVSTQFASLPHTSPADDNQRMLSYFQGNAAFKASGVQPGGCVWARFSDDTALVFVNDGSVSASSGAGLQSGTNNTPTGQAALASPTELPSGKKVYLSNNISTSLTADGLSNALLGSLVGVSNQTLAAELGNVGYSVTQLPGTVASLRTIANADVLYLYAHLGLFLTPAGSLGFGLTTTTPLFDTSGTAFDLTAYNALLQDILDGNVSFVMYVDFDTSTRQPVAKPYYMIMPGFISKYITLSSQSFVFINGCEAYSTAFGPLSNIYAAFGLNNAAVFASWDEPVDGIQALLSGQMLLEGLSGKYAPGTGPRLRPFAYPDMLTYMRATKRSGSTLGYDQSSGSAGTATLNVEPARSGAVVGLLAPSIASLGPQTGTLTINGSFGDSPQGTVTVGGQSIPVQNWTASRIICTLPDADKPGGAGPVIVTVNGLQSNPVALTAWPVTFHYSISYDSSTASTSYDTLSGSYTLTATLELWLRADIHKGRVLPGDTPPSPTIVTDLNGLSLPTNMAKLTAYSVSGTITHTVHTGDINNPLDKTVIETVTVDGSAPYPYDGTVSVLPTQPSAFSLASRAVNPGTGTLKFLLRAVLPTYTTNISDRSVLGVASFSSVLSSQGLGPGGDGTITMSFDASGNIAGGSAPPNGTATLSWDQASPAGGSAPDPNAAS